MGPSGCDGRLRDEVIEAHEIWLELRTVAAIDVWRTHHRRDGSDFSAGIQPRRREAAFTGDDAWNAMKAALNDRGSATTLRLECSGECQRGGMCHGEALAKAARLIVASARGATTDGDDSNGGGSGGNGGGNDGSGGGGGHGVGGDDDGGGAGDDDDGSGAGADGDDGDAGDDGGGGGDGNDRDDGGGGVDGRADGGGSGGGTASGGGAARDDSGAGHGAEAGDDTDNARRRGPRKSSAEAAARIGTVSYLRFLHGGERQVPAATRAAVQAAAEAGLPPPWLQGQADGSPSDAPEQVNAPLEVHPAGEAAEAAWLTSG